MPPAWEGEGPGGWQSETGEQNPGRPGEEGPQVRDWGHYFKTIKDLRAQSFARSMDSALSGLLTDACLAAEDFGVKCEAELATRQSVESDIDGLQKVPNDTNVTRLRRRWRPRPSRRSCFS